MRQFPDAGAGDGPRFHVTSLAAGLVCSLALVACQAAPGAIGPDPTVPEPVATTTSTSLTTTTTIPVPDTRVDLPLVQPVYEVAANEVARDAKQAAVEVVHRLTNYDEDADHARRLLVLGDRETVLGDSVEALTRPVSWSRGEVIYPQLGGLTDDRASVMVVTRQTIGKGGVVERSVVRTIDVRLVRGDGGWQFDHLASTGGAFQSLEELALAHAVANDPRIEMPDSARLDIMAGLVSPVLLEVMSQLADITPYGVTVLATGHPHNVFETDRQSHHTVGRAVDIHRIGDNLVIDDHEEGSGTMLAMIWMLAHPDVVQVGGPWDFDGKGSSRSFTNTVHLDHVHLAVRN